MMSSLVNTIYSISRCLQCRYMKKSHSALSSEKVCFVGFFFLGKKEFICYFFFASTPLGFFCLNPRCQGLRCKERWARKGCTTVKWEKGTVSVWSPYKIRPDQFGGFLGQTPILMVQSKKIPIANIYQLMLYVCNIALMWFSNTCDKYM